MTVEESAQEYVAALDAKPYDDEAAFQLYSKGIDDFGQVPLDTEIGKIILVR